MFEILGINFRYISVYFCLVLFEVLTAQSLKNYGQYCNNSSFPIVSSKCKDEFVCHQNRCKCPPGFGYDKTLSKCIDYDDYLCDDILDCNDLDPNRRCNYQNNKCECNLMDGFREIMAARLCKKTMNSLLNDSCATDMDCAVDYSHCKDSVCRCWPEFNEDILHTTGICVRKICLDNSVCQTDDNPNLICNNTICECEYGYAMDIHRMCVKLTRRQNCNITCQIIGGLFASIFMLSLIYWCFYCCYSIVKNYKTHNRIRNSVNTNSNINDSPQVERFLRRQSTNQRNDPNFAINPSEERFYCFDNESPPTYSQLSDSPPDYETVVHMKQNDSLQTQ